MKKVMICVIVALAMVQLMVEPSQAMINCVDVTKCLVQCISYLTGAVSEPVAGCCDGVKELKAMANTPQDKREVCKCIKKAATQLPNINYKAAGALPGKCGTPLPFPIVKDMDCKSIS